MADLLSWGLGLTVVASEETLKPQTESDALPEAVPVHLDEAPIMTLSDDLGRVLSFKRQCFVFLNRPSQTVDERERDTRWSTSGEYGVFWLWESTSSMTPQHKDRWWQSFVSCLSASAKAQTGWTCFRGSLGLWSSLSVQLGSTCPTWTVIRTEQSHLPAPFHWSSVGHLWFIYSTKPQALTSMWSPSGHQGQRYTSHSTTRAMEHLEGEMRDLEDTTVQSRALKQQKK